MAEKANRYGWGGMVLIALVVVSRVGSPAMSGDPDPWLGNPTTEVGAPEDELDALNVIFREGGFETRAAGGIVELSAQEYGAWIVVLGVGGGVANFLRAYSSKLGELAAEDTRHVLRHLVKRIVAARGSRDTGQVEIEDLDSRTTIHFRLDLPDHAYRRLFELDWANARGGIGWNETAGDWTDMEGTALPERTN